MFDLDGTLVDSFPAISISVDRTVDDLGRPRPAAEDLRALVGSPLNKVFDQVLGRAHEHLIELRALPMSWQRCPSWWPGSPPILW